MKKKILKSNFSVEPTEMHKDLLGRKTAERKEFPFGFAFFDFRSFSAIYSLIQNCPVFGNKRNELLFFQFAVAIHN